MSASPAPRVRALAVHAAYRCRSTGACCSSGWDVPVEPAAEDGLRAALASGALGPADVALRPVAGLPHGARVVFAQDAAGRCVFLEAEGERRLCAVHRRLGEDALPSACRQFPRVVTLTPLGVSVTLSHYCPTAADLLFGTPMGSVPPGSEGPAVPPGPSGSLRSRDPLLHVVEDPPAFPPSWPWEGLDARDALPPFVRPGVLMSWPGLERWERFALDVLADEERTPEDALDVLEGAAEEVRRWTPERGEFEGFLEGVLGRGRGSEGGEPAFPGALRNGSRYPRDPARRGSRGCPGSREWQLVAECVPVRALVPPTPVGLDETDARWVAPAWPGLGRPIRRWLAGKAFASWLVLQGEGLRTAVLGLRVALGVLRAEAARGCAEAGRALDALLLKEAFRRADLLLVHLADAEALARKLGRAETGESGPTVRMDGTPPDFENV
ncbi:MAG TPA: hypothetical protein VGB87_12795 [Vicinamibacteria bacterium]